MVLSMLIFSDLGREQWWLFWRNIVLGLGGGDWKRSSANARGFPGVGSLGRPLIGVLTL